jgi:uncharacterized phiE125 gp8 family phage protein
VIPDTVFTLAKAKAHLRVPHSDEDSLITAMLDAAVAEVERITRRAWTERTWSVVLDACDVGETCNCDSPVFHALLSPATAKVFVDDPAGVGPSVELPASDVFMSTRFGHSIVNVRSWSAPHATEGNAGRIDYTAKPTGDFVPPDIYAAAMLYLGDLYENRESQIVGIAVAQNQSAEILLRPYIVDMHA